MGSMRLLVVCAVVVCALASPQCPPPSTSGRSGGGGGGMSNGGGGQGGQGGQMGQGGQGGQMGQGGQGGQWDQGMDGGDDGKGDGKGDMECDCKSCMKQNVASFKCLPDFPQPQPCMIANTTSEQSVNLVACGSWSVCALGPATLGDIQLYYCTPDCPTLKKKAQVMAPYFALAVMLDPVGRYPQGITSKWSAGTKAYVRGLQDFMVVVTQIHLDYCMLSNSDIGMQG